MSDVTTKENSASAPAAAEQTASAPSTTNTNDQPKTQPQSRPKPKFKSSKPRRARQRRRAAADNDLSGDEAGGQSDSSLTSQSDDGGDSEDEEERTRTRARPAKPASASAAAPAKTAAPKTKSVFDDVSSLTPTAWSKDEVEDVEPISFEDFNAGKELPAGPARGGLSIRGRGAKAGKPVVEERPKKEFTPEQTAKYEAKKAKRKEKERAKRAEQKEEKLKGKPTAPTPAPASASAANGESSASAAPTPSATTAPAPTKPAKAKGKKKLDSTAVPVSTPITELANFTSALSLDDSAPASADKAADKPVTESAANTQAESPDVQPAASTSQPQRPPRQPRASMPNGQAPRTAEDPKVTPRTGQFWTHDQRLNDGNGHGNGGEGGFRGGPRQMHPFAARGRGAFPPGPGNFRGGPRGRGRGGFFPPFAGRGGFVNGAGGPPRSAAANAVELSQEDKEEGSSKLAMDREQELAEAREKARTGPGASADPVQHAQSEAVDVAPRTTAPPRAGPGERKWGHEGFEAMSAPDQFRGGLRGRGRGARGGRGTFVPRGMAHLPYAPANRAATEARVAAAANAPSPAPSAAAPEVSKPVVDDRERMSTQPTADSLLDPADESVKIKFPGSAGSVVPATPSPAAPSAPAPLPQTAPPAPEPQPAAVVVEAAVPVQQQEPQFPSLHTSSPAPAPAPIAAVQAQMYTGGSAAGSSPFPMGSENGSVGSAQFVQHSGGGQFYAPGMTPNGEFIPSSAMPHVQQRPAFYPQHSQRGYPAQSPGFYPPPSPYSPNPYEQQMRAASGAPMGSPQGMYFPGTANGYANGRSSPLNPYMVANGNGGYFAPAQSRASAKVAIRAPAQQDQSHTPGDEGSGIGANGNPEHAEPNGNQSAGFYPGHYNPYVQPFIPGQRHEAMYYPGQQYAAYQGYNGEQAYYDTSAYGY